MIRHYFKDGQPFDKNWFIKEGFIIDDRDFRKTEIDDLFSGESKPLYVVDFVGFLLDENNDLIVSFPKNYKVTDPYNDAKLLFKVLNRHLKIKPTTYSGDRSKQVFNSNFPFYSFFKIYDYYKKYGLPYNEFKYLRENTGDKIDWKATVRNSKKFIVNNELVMYPFYSSVKLNITDFVADCVTYSINYTIDKFGLLLNCSRVENPRLNENTFKNYKIVIQRLHSIYNITFIDNLKILLQNLINFFKEINFGNGFYLKHYAFNLIWEDMVLQYINHNFVGINRNSLQFNENKDNSIQFKKEIFHPNKAIPLQRVEPDYYYSDDNVQYIFDAKYYSEIKKLDYKQIAYYLFLNELDNHSRDRKTYSAIITPSMEDNTNLHFEFNSAYNNTYSDLIILETGLDIKKIMKAYLIF